MRIIILLTSLFLTANIIQAVTILVPSEQPTIQAGINVATEGDTVLVAPGTYIGDGNRNLTFNGVNLVLKSEMGADVTIVDCQGNSLEHHVAVLLNNGEDTTSIIDGFTFTNAYYAKWGYVGGALYFQHGNAIIQNCIITNSLAYGIFLEGVTDITPCRISNCVIENNINGILNFKVGTIIENCIVRNNYGVGIEFWDETEIRNCLVVHNKWVGITKAGGMSTPLALIENCTIAFNGIGFSYDITLPRTNSELIEVDTTTIQNSIIAYNTTAGIYNYFDMEGEYNCINSNVFGNGGYNWQNDKYSHGDEFGNISVNPLFCDTTIGNYYLGERSPCASVNNSSGSTIGVYDIGCGCCVGIRGNIVVDSNDQIDITDLVYLIAWMFMGGVPLDCMEEGDVDGSGGFNISDLVVLVEYMFENGVEPAPCN